MNFASTAASIASPIERVDEPLDLPRIALRSLCQHRADGVGRSRKTGDTIRNSVERRRQIIVA
jgi:hypothetical protein